VFQGYDGSAAFADARGRFVTTGHSNGTQYGILDLTTRRFAAFPQAPRGWSNAGATGLSADGRWAAYEYEKLDHPNRCYLFSRVSRRSMFLGDCGSGNVGISENGALVLYPGVPPGSRAFFLEFPAGRIAAPTLYHRTTRAFERVPAPGAALSDDGKTIAFACYHSVGTARADLRGDVYLYSLATHTYSQAIADYPGPAGPLILSSLSPSGSAVFASNEVSDSSDHQQIGSFVRATTSDAQPLGTEIPAECLAQ
jgi:hypothetical protein